MLLEMKYMGSYLEERKRTEGGKGNAKQYVYSTPQGRAFANNNDNPNAFTFIIAIPITLAVSYILTMVVLALIKLL